MPHIRVIFVFRLAVLVVQVGVGRGRLGVLMRCWVEWVQLQDM